jgi:hypothetical protein
MIEFVISCNVDNVWELRTDTPQKITEALCGLLATPKLNVCTSHGLRVIMQILGDHDIARQNENVGAILILDIDITELKM